MFACAGVDVNIGQMTSGVGNSRHVLLAQAAVGVCMVGAISTLGPSARFPLMAGFSLAHAF
jgi:hypothetical protein